MAPPDGEAAKLKALSDPLRLRMGLLLIDEPRTVKELAAALQVPPTRLYYHVRILEEQGLIEVAERRLVSGIEERRYRAIEENWVVAPDITASTVETSGVIASLFDAVRAEVEVVLHDHPDETVGERGSAVAMITLTDMRLSVEDVVEFRRRLQVILDDFGPGRTDTAPDARPHHFLLVGYEIPGARRAP